MSLRLVAGLATALAVVTGASFALQEHDRRDLDAGNLRREPLRYAMTRLVTPTPERAVGSTSAADRVAQGWLRRTGARTGLQVAALRAYAQAELGLKAGPDRGCRVGWPTLAGIGWVESHHGTLGGRTLHADGRSSTPILGPALDGTGGFAAIRATPGAYLLHGDDRWEHAVGPMQFLPGTWRLWGTDGDRDGRADPLDLDDAAAGSARLLCAGGRDLGSVRGWESAVLSYNRSRAYVDEVYAAATGYAAAAGP